MPAPLSPGWFPQWRLPRPLRRAGRRGGGRGVRSADLPCSEVAVGCQAGGPQLCGLLEPAWEQSRWGRSTWQAGWCPRGSAGHRAAGVRGWSALVSGRSDRAHLPVCPPCRWALGWLHQAGATWWSGALFWGRASCWCPLMLLLHTEPPSERVAGQACCCGCARGERVPLSVRLECRTVLSQLPPPVVLAPTASDAARRMDAVPGPCWCPSECWAPVPGGLVSPTPARPPGRSLGPLGLPCPRGTPSLEHCQDPRGGGCPAFQAALPVPEGSSGQKPPVAPGLLLNPPGGPSALA